MILLPHNSAICQDTGNFSILVDDHEVGEVPGDALRDDSLQCQTSSVEHVSVWYYGGQLLTKSHRPLQEGIEAETFKTYSE